MICEGAWLGAGLRAGLGVARSWVRSGISGEMNLGNSSREMYSVHCTLHTLQCILYSL